MTLHITTGRVIFARSVQPAQFETKRAEVELTFAIPEGEALSDTLDQVAAIAQAKCLEMVGLQKAASTPAATTPAATTPAATTPAATTAKAEPKPETTKVEVKETKTSVPKSGKGATRTKADIEKETTDKLNGKGAATVADAASVVEEQPQISTGEARVDPAQLSDDDILGPLSADDTAKVVEEITDAELLSKVSAHNAKIKNPMAIRQLIGKQFDKPEGKQAKDIPQEKRAAFIEALLKL